MFCNQCEQTAKGYACTKVGVCGKSQEVDWLQDLLVYALSGLSEVALEARGKDGYLKEVDPFTCEALFVTLTNVNFDPESIANYIRKAVSLREELKKLAGKDFTSGPSTFTPKEDLDGLIEQGKEVELTPENYKENEDIFSLKLTTLYGLKGVAAYAFHAYELGKEDQDLFDFIHRTMVKIYGNGDMKEWLNTALEVGKYNLRAMELLDAGHTETYGHPKPTEVPLGSKKGKAILVSGHDLKALYELLKQTEGKGIFIYTHGEMLPAHGYPELKKFSHLYGHYGTAWQNQQREFAEFPGPILMTTNCIIAPKDSYKDRIYTMGPVGFPGVKHIEGYDFSQIVQHALELPGFEKDEDKGSVMVGFARKAVLDVADKIIELVKSGKIRHFFLVGGCDGTKTKRSYYTEFVEKAPKDTVILTLACGKFRFFDKKLGDIEGIPRLIDIGQCNDAYSAIQIAKALADAFGVDINSLPLSLILSWFEQKAVSILLTLLYLGVKNMKIGPSAPAFFSPGVMKFVQENYNLQLIKTPDEDLKEILG